MNIKLKDTQDFGKRLILAGFSQRSFAKHIGISVPYMNQIVNDNRNPSAKIAKKVCDGLDAAFDDIFFIHKDNKSYQTKTTA